MRNLAILASLVSLVVLASSRPADACSPPPPWQGRALFPTDGATDVPTNARIAVTHLLEYYSIEDAEDLFTEVSLRAADGSVVEVDVTYAGETVTIVPAVELAPFTTYELLDRIDEACLLDYGYPDPDCPAIAADVFASFTTGAGPDGVAPSFAGVDGIGTGRHVEHDDSSECSIDDYFVYPVVWPAATGDAHVRYDVFVTHDGVERAIARGVVEAEVIDSCDGYDRDERILHGDTIRVAAVDAAGNRNDAAAIYTFERNDCVDDVGACSVGAGRAPGGLAPVLLALFLLGFHIVRKL